MTAENLWSYLSGFEVSKTPFNCASFSSELKGIKALNALLGFKFFSPSRDAVSIKAAPPYPEDAINIRSAGNISSASVITISPTITLLQLTSTNLPSLITFVIVP